MIIVGILLDESSGSDGAGSFSRKEHYALRKSYFKSVEKAGGVPVGIPYSYPSLTNYLDLVDGWLIPGGEYAFDRSWYERPPSGLPESPGHRHAFEKQLVTQALYRNTPMLGICAGMQLMAGLLGAKFTREERPENGPLNIRPTDYDAYHNVEVSPGSLLHDILQVRTLRVNSAHLERVSAVSDSLKVTALSDDGGVEAIEIIGKRFALGVQWHPERSLTPDGYLLIQALVRAAAS